MKPAPSRHHEETVPARRDIVSARGRARPRLSTALPLLVALCAVVSSTPAAFAQSTGVAQGMVINGTEGKPAAGVRVTVQVFQRMAQVDEKTIATDSHGRYRMDGLPAASDNRYIVSVTHDRVHYGLKEAINPNAPQDPPVLTIYEKTESAAAISILSASAAVTSIDSSSGLLQVLEVLTVNNNSRLVYVGDLLTDPAQGGALRVPLIGPALDLKLGEGFSDEGVLATPTRIVTRSPVFPGQTALVFDYKVLYDQRTVSLSRAFEYPVARASFIVGSGGPKLASNQLTKRETVSIDGKANIVLSGQGFAPGQAIAVTLTGLQKMSGSVGAASRNALLRYGGVGVAAFAMAALAVYVLVSRRRRRRQPASAMAGAAPSGDGLSEREALASHRRALVAAIADLDKRFEAGAVSRQQYDATRADLRQRLTDVALLIRDRETVS